MNQMSLWKVLLVKVPQLAPYSYVAMPVVVDAADPLPLKEVTTNQHLG